MIPGEINATGTTGLVNVERTQSQWGQCKREKSARVLKCQVHKCNVRAAGHILLCLRSCTCTRALVLVAE